jgi:hypothetical protein
MRRPTRPGDTRTMNYWHPYTHRRRELSAPRPRTTRLGSSRPLILAIAIVALIAGAVMAIALSSAGQPARYAATKDTSVLRSLTPQERRYVTGIASLSPARLHGAFGTDRVSSADSALASLTAEQQRYARAISSLSYEQVAAAFGAAR